MDREHIDTAIRAAAQRYAYNMRRGCRCLRCRGLERAAWWPRAGNPGALRAFHFREGLLHGGWN